MCMSFPDSKFRNQGQFSTDIHNITDILLLHFSAKTRFLVSSTDLVNEPLYLDNATRHYLHMT